MSVASIRDIAIVLLAIESLIIGGLLIVLVLQIRNLINVLKDEVKPILGEARDTVSTVKGTTSFVSDTVITPIVNMASFASAVRQSVATFRSPTRKRAANGEQGHEGTKEGT